MRFTIQADRRRDKPTDPYRCGTWVIVWQRADSLVPTMPRPERTPDTTWGGVDAALFRDLLADGWVRPRRRIRAVDIMRRGAAQLHARFGVRC